MENKVLSEAFASGPRMKILNLVSTSPAGILGISEALGISATAVRFHVQKLVASGLLVEVEERSHVGRPRILYKASGKHEEIGFPARNYLQLAEVLIRTLLANPDQARMKEQLEEVGTAYASSIAKDLMARLPDERWDSSSFKKYVVKGALAEWGAQPEVSAISRETLQYRCYNCLFKELAEKYPQLICDVLDNALHKEMCKQLNPDIDWKKLKCAGHGDGYCEYLLTWKSSQRL